MWQDCLIKTYNEGMLERIINWWLIIIYFYCRVMGKWISIIGEWQDSSLHLLLIMESEPHGSHLMFCNSGKFGSELEWKRYMRQLRWDNRTKILWECLTESITNKAIWYSVGSVKEFNFKTVFKLYSE